MKFDNFIPFFVVVARGYYKLAKVDPGLNLAVFLAGILMAFFVRGLIPFLALLSETEKVPNPTNTTFPPFLTSLEMASKVASNAFFESTLLSPDCWAIASINSDLFIRKRK